MKVKYVTLVLLLSTCQLAESSKKTIDSDKMTEEKTTDFVPKYMADSFDFPVGKPNAKRYYNAQPFGENDHLGDDWNGTGGGNTDLGDPIYAIGNGYVKAAKNYDGGWGNIVRVVHFLPNGEVYESFYAHCDTLLTEAGKWVKRGEQIGTIGNVDGMYLAHLHFEVRADTSLPIGAGYSPNTEGYLDPTTFIEQHRKVVKMNDK